jgi:hypothetical protein
LRQPRLVRSGAARRAGGAAGLAPTHVAERTGARAVEAAVPFPHPQADTISAAAYNDIEDYGRLADIVARVVRKAG